ncbi:MAG: CDP-glycerol glycerophosphotransferase family protein [Bifidobacteriaceae bacterium]|jgi:CDP-glycerol glycerophosphotransferase (TagB/SpsB family)|nr:CDP-glycerol glycerophosphotransferase family protein [Bifidobacteriaceae bacterium]
MRQALHGIKRLIRRIGRQLLRPFRRLKRRIRRTLFFRRNRWLHYILGYKFWSRRPVDPHQVAFLSDSRAGFSGNFEFLKAELERQDPAAKIVGIFRPGLAAHRPWRDLIALPKVMATSRIILVDDFYPLIYPIEIRPESELIQVWHAVGAFKRVGWSRLGLPGGPVPGGLTHKNYTWATCSAEAIRADYAEAYGIDVSKVLALGVPRTDVFFDQALIRERADAVRAEYGIAPGQKIVLFAPTFRGHGQRTAHYPDDWVDWDRLADQLGDGWRVLVKMHPFCKPLDELRPDVQKVTDVTRVREINDLLMAADVLVTDYSSTIFEYAMLRRPMVFFVPDLEEYISMRDFYRPFDHYTVGTTVTDGAELADAIAHATVDEAQMDQFVARFTEACDGHSTERIVSDLLVPGAKYQTDTARF